MRKVNGVRTVAAMLALAAIWLPTGSGVARGQNQPAAPEFRTEVVADGVIFRFDARELNPVPTRLFLVGTFNSWNRAAEEMRGDGTGRFELRRALPDGVHHYKFYTPEGERWLTDPASDREMEIEDGWGNSAVLVGPDGRRLPPPPAGGVRAEAIRFVPTATEGFNVVMPGRVRVGLQLQAGDVTAINLLTEDGARHRLHRAETRIGMEHWTGIKQVPTTGTVRYVIELIDGDSRNYLTAAGVLATADFASAFASDVSVSFPTPYWTKHAVWYQVFVERFRNGEPANDPGTEPFERLIRWQANWWETQPGEVPGAENFYRGAGNVWQRRFGGDIQGLQQKLPYLRSLGVNALYLNPVFEAHSMHKYDARDFRHIDDNFSIRRPHQVPKSEDPATWVWTEGDRLFLDFLAEARRQGFRVVIDGVFNHVGRDHPYFQDVMQRGQASPFADWFVIDGWPATLPAREADFGQPHGLRFRAWDGPSGHLPVFRQDPLTGLAPGPFRHMMNITRRWTAPDGDPSRGVDGWRLDVANEVPHTFWILWRDLVKELNPDAYITGEIWSPAQPWLQGDQFDGVMNYQFAMRAQRFFVNQNLATTPSQFAAELVNLVGMYPLQALMASQNLYDSHDTDRLASMFVNPDLQYDAANRLQDNGPNYSKARPNAEQRLRKKQAAAFQMFFIGAPMVYYGTEAGMWSPDDPSNRMPMVWPDLEPFDDPQVQFDEGMFEHYQRIIAIRNALRPLRTGYFNVLLTQDAEGVLAFSRPDFGGTVIVVVNRSAQERTVAVPVPDGAGDRWINYMNPASVQIVPPGDAPDARPTVRVLPDATVHLTAGGTVGVTIPPWGTAVLVPPNVR